MSYDAILQVNKAEETARGSLTEAQTKAREIVTAAQTAANERLAETKLQIAAETAEALRIEREKNHAYAEAQLAISQKECDLLRGKALSQIDVAVARVMERVMS